MPTELAVTSGHTGRSALAARRILRLAFGTGLSLWISQAVGWDISYIAPVLTMLLLAMPMARLKPKFIVVVVAALAVTIYGSFVFLPLLLHQKIVGLLLVGLALFHSFYFTARGGTAIVGTLITVGLALTVGIGTVSVDALLAVASGLMFGAAVGTAVAVLSHLLFADPIAAASKPAAAKKEPDVVADVADAARRHAMRSLAVVAPILLWFVISGSSASNIAVLIKVAAMGQEVSRQGTRAAAKSLIVSTLAGGFAAIIAWEVLSMWPSLLLYTLLIVLAGLVFGPRIFKGDGLHDQADTWNYAYLTMIVVLAPAVLDGSFGSSADARFYDRLLMFAWATIYGVGAVYVFDAFWSGDRRNGR